MKATQKIAELENDLRLIRQSISFWKEIDKQERRKDAAEKEVYRWHRERMRPIRENESRSWLFVLFDAEGNLYERIIPKK